MNAAEKLFLSKGFVSTTVSEIVLSADVAKGPFIIIFNLKMISWKPCAHAIWTGI
ncbi:TetR family transcriptional regulator [Providencia hangzhouensis]|uniref:TetR family transcriptional regulator n=1 Tax=Providencia hangzhouensis TaxID=3031799 RepID=UPI0034DD315A